MSSFSEYKALFLRCFAFISKPCNEWIDYFNILSFAFIPMKMTYVTASFNLQASIGLLFQIKMEEVAYKYRYIDFVMVWKQTKENTAN